MARGARMLRTALGPAIAGFLEDPMIVEVMLNPDGRLWIDRLSVGLSDTGATLSPADGERIVRLVAHHVGAEVHTARPRVSAELPETGERFEGLLPPVVTAPCFAIRKPAVAVFSLADYVASGIMTETQAALLREGVAARANILVAGGTSTGKTTLTNALLAEVAGSSDRVVIIEDTRELQCTHPTSLPLPDEGTGVASPFRSRRLSLRLRAPTAFPSRGPGAEAPGPPPLGFLKKPGGTVHPGGIIETIHARFGPWGSAPDGAAHSRRPWSTGPRALIAETIDLIRRPLRRGAGGPTAAPRPEGSHRAMEGLGTRTAITASPRRRCRPGRTPTTGDLS